MKRRELFKKLLAVSSVALMPGVPAGAEVATRGKKCVLLADSSMLSVQQTMRIGQSLGLPAGTQIIMAYPPQEGKRLSDYFEVLEVEIG